VIASWESSETSAATTSRPTKSSVRTEKLAFAAIDEARVVLPGIQALFGFQLICGIQRPLP